MKVKVDLLALTKKINDFNYNNSKTIKNIIIYGPLLLSGIFSIFGNQNLGTDALNPPKDIIEPPNYIFGIVWPILYLLMGYSTYKIYKNNLKIELTFLVQLIINYYWPFTFNINKLRIAYKYIKILLLLVIINFIIYINLNKNAGLLFLPYVAWLIFANLLLRGYIKNNPSNY